MRGKNFQLHEIIMRKKSLVNQWNLLSISNSCQRKLWGIWKWRKKSKTRNSQHLAFLLIKTIFKFHKNTTSCRWGRRVMSVAHEIILKGPLIWRLSFIKGLYRVACWDTGFPSRKWKRCYIFLNINSNYVSIFWGALVLHHMKVSSDTQSSFKTKLGNVWHEATFCQTL